MANCTETYKFLDLGCGPSERGQGWFYLDIQKPENMSEEKKAGFVQGDARYGLPFKDQVFNHVVLSQVLEHFVLPDGKRLLQECYRVLKFKGTIEIATPNAKTLGYALWKIEDYDISLQPHFSLDLQVYPYGECTGPHCIGAVWGWEHAADVQYQHHRICYNVNMLKNLLTECKFTIMNEIINRSWFLHTVAQK